MLALPDPPTALFAASDDLAHGAMRATRARGFEILAQLSVIGFDDTMIIRWTQPQLPARSGSAARAPRGHRSVRDSAPRSGSKHPNLVLAHLHGGVVGRELDRHLCRAEPDRMLADRAGA